MIELERFSVEGLRSLAQVDDIPLRRPTIVTGANDGGKSTTLRAIDFLLGGPAPDDADYTLVGPGSDDAEPLRAERVVVTGSFSLDSSTADELGLKKTIKLRRVADVAEGARYELHSMQPQDFRLRGLEDRKLADLKLLAGELGIEPVGSRAARQSWLEPLREHVAAQPHEEAWIGAPPDLIPRLPRFMLFSSTDEPDPEGQIQTALRTAFKQLLQDEKIVGPVRDAEDAVQTRLADQAADLCRHIGDRCPELATISVAPTVTFSEGFRRVEVLASREGGAGVPLNRSGAGRRRRVNLAVWEWTGELLDNRPDPDRSVVIGYDEPDTHLDYAHQRELVTLIRDQSAKPGVRMLVATHSLNLIDRVNIEDVVHLRLVDQRTEVERLITAEHDEIQRYLVGVSQAMGLRNSVLLHERSFVCVEGPTEVGVLPVVFRLVTGWSLQSAGIALISGNGNDGALQVIRFLKEHGRRLAFVLVDADSSDQKLFRKDKLNAVGVSDDDIFYVGQRELEDLFTDEQWAATANREWPRQDHRPWSAQDFAALRGGSKFSSAVASTVRGAASRAPSGKPGYLLALVQGLRQATDVPGELAKVLRKLATLAAA